MVKPMAKKKKDIDKSTDFSTWRNRIEFNMSHNETQGNRRQFQRLKDYVRGNYQKWLKVSVPLSIVNTAYAVVKTMCANLYIRDPYIAVNPLTMADIDSARLQEQVINSDWKKLHLKREVKKAIEDTITVGRGFIKIGYTAKIGKEENKGEFNEFVEEENIWAVHVPWEHVGYDIEAKDPPYDCRYMYHWYYKPTDWLNEKYKDVLGDKEIMPTSTLGEKYGKREQSESDFKRTKVVEVLDKDSGYKMTYCDGYDDWLEKIPPVEKNCIGPYKIKGFPIYMLKFEDECGSEDNLPLAPLEMVTWQIEEKIKMRSMQLNHVKRFSRQVFAKQNSMEQTELAKYEDGIDGAIILTNDIPSNCVYVPAYPPIQTDIYAIENKIDIDLSTVIGQSGADRGGALTTNTRTLGEIDNIQAGTNNRNMERQDRVEDFCESVAKGLIGLERQFYDAEQYVKINGEVPFEFLQRMKEQGKFDGVSLKFTKEDIQGDYQMNIKIGSTLPLDKQNRLKVVSEFLRFGQALGLGPGSFTSFAIGQEIARDLEMKTVEKAFQIDMKVLRQKMEEAKKPNPKEQLDMMQKQMNLQRGQKSLETSDNRMASNTQSTIKKALDNSDRMSGKNEQLNDAQKKLNLIKTREDIKAKSRGGR